MSNDHHVDAEIRAVSAGRLSETQLVVLLEGLDRARFIAPDGRVDEARVEALVDALAPAAGAKRDKGAAAGLAEAQRRFGKVSV